MSKNMEIATRLKDLREIMDISTQEMAKVTGISEDEYIKYESGKKDFSVTFLYNCAEKFGVDVTALLTGETPKLKSYSIVRKNEGVKTNRREMFVYEHLANNFNHRHSEPFLVVAPYIEKTQHQPISLSSHKGQEMDYILSGAMRISINGKEEIVREGDTVYYDSSQPHGMIAIDGKECRFLAILIKDC